MIDVHLANGDAVARRIAAFASGYPDTIRRSMSIWTRGKAVPELKKAAPTGATEHTKNAIRGWATKRPEGPAVVLTAPTANATYEEFGTKEHPVNPRYRKALRIPLTTGGFLFIGPRLATGRAAGRMLVRWPGGVGLSKTPWAPAVTIPARPARPWFFPTIDRLLPELNQQIADDVKKAADKWFAGTAKGKG